MSTNQKVEKNEKATEGEGDFLSSSELSSIFSKDADVYSPSREGDSDSQTSEINEFSSNHQNAQLKDNKNEPRNQNNIDSIEYDTAEKCKSRKRKQTPANWTKNKKKFLRNSGEKYKLKSGKIVGAKKMRDACDEKKCHHKCSMKISEDIRKNLFKNYWPLASLQRQRNYLHGCIPNSKISSYCKRDTKESELSLSFSAWRKENRST